MRQPVEVAMEVSSVTSKGQIVIPVRVRRRHGIKTGTKVCFVEKGDEIVLRPVTDEYLQRMSGAAGTKGKILRTYISDQKKS